MINILVPMAGRGSRFAGTEGDWPKPLIEVVPGRRMIEYVIDYLTLAAPHRFVFVGLREHDRAVGYASFLRSRTERYELLLAEKVTRGPAATALLAAALIDSDDELLIAYCDSFLRLDIEAFLAAMRQRRADGAVITYPSTDPMDSYVDIDTRGQVRRAEEKKIISPHATAGLYYFRRGRDFVAAARAMLAAAEYVSNEIFVCPAYNALIAEGQAVYAYPVQRSCVVEMGTPRDLAEARIGMAARPARIPDAVLAP